MKRKYQTPRAIKINSHHRSISFPVSDLWRCTCVFNITLLSSGNVWPFSQPCCLLRQLLLTRRESSSWAPASLSRQSDWWHWSQLGWHIDWRSEGWPSPICFPQRQSCQSGMPYAPFNGSSYESDGSTWVIPLLT